MQPKVQVLEVWGDLACFTMPVLKVERFSYPIITPSAARGIFDAICVNRHKYGWRITKIELLSPPRHVALLRNEVKEKLDINAVPSWISGRKEVEPIWADLADEKQKDKGRTQRQTMALKNVHYRLHAYINPLPEYASEIVGMEAKFRRRAGAGQCFQQPYFGCREFPASFRLLEIDEVGQAPIAYSQKLGWMPYDLFDLSRPGTSNDTAFISAFDAELIDGVLDVPEFESDAVRKPVRG